MDSGIGQSLSNLSSTVFTWFAIGFVLLNAAAAAAVALSRSRTLVDRWTGRYLAANVVLIGVGLGVPVVAQAVRLVINALAAVPGVVLSK